MSNDIAEEAGGCDSLDLELFKLVAAISECENLIIRHYPDDEMKTPMHMSVGDESCVAGVVECFRRDSYFFGYYRTHSLYLAVSRDPYKFFAELLGRSTGANGGIAGSMHMSAPSDGLLNTSAIVASTIPLALGAGLSCRLLGDKKYSVIFFGDGAIEEGVFHESMNMAALYGLPVLFVCLDNGLAVDLEASSRQGFTSIKRLVDAYDCNYLSIKDPSVVEAYTVASQAKALLSQFDKPVFLHMSCYRYLQHIGIVDDFSEKNVSTFEKSNYRSLEMHEAYLQKTPLAVAISEMKQKGWEQAVLDAAIDKVSEEVSTAYSSALKDHASDYRLIKDKVYFD